MKSIDTLVEDIYSVITSGEGWTTEISKKTSDRIAKQLDRQFHRTSGRGSNLRMSNLGTPCKRKLWYSTHGVFEPEPTPPHVRNKFLFGDFVEQYVLGLCEAAGHTVEGLQTEVYIGSIRGSRDCIIDGMLVDVKSASSESFKKFRANGLRENDPFGYLSQLSSYLFASRNDPLLKYQKEAAFLVMDKQFGHIHLDRYDLTDYLERKEEEVAEVIKVCKDTHPPERPYEPVPMGKSGNMKLDTACSYCDFKRHCWPEARGFLYSNGPVWLTKVVKEPDVWEMT
jgi:CRISPR/Cas system-associated exonuclease Cas4 (RecB family)